MGEFGTDLSWNKSDTSLETVSDNENIVQSVINRLNTTYEELNWVYSHYGCNYHDYIGLKANETNLEFIKNSIKQALDEEERITNYDLELSYISNGVVNVILNINGVNMELQLGDGL